MYAQGGIIAHVCVSLYMYTKICLVSHHYCVEEVPTTELVIIAGVDVFVEGIPLPRVPPAPSLYC